MWPVRRTEIADSNCAEIICMKQKAQQKENWIDQAGGYV